MTSHELANKLLALPDIRILKNDFEDLDKPTLMETTDPDQLRDLEDEFELDRISRDEYDDLCEQIPTVKVILI